MVKYFKDDFDTEILGGAVYKLWLEGRIESGQAFEQEIAATSPKYIYAFTPFEISNIQLLEKNNFRLISIRSTYDLPKLDLIQNTTLPEGFEMVMVSSGVPELEKEEILKIGRTIGETSRYFNDPFIPEQAAMDIYYNWIHNSIFEGYADDVLLIMKENEIVGLHTLKIRERTGYIDLIGIREIFQNKGLGKVLMMKGLERLVEMGAEKISVITEGENLQGNIFYQKNGFLVRKVELVYHKHFI